MVHCYFHKHKQASILGSCRSYFTLLIRHLLLWTHTHTHTLAVSRRAENAHWNTNDHRETKICRYIVTKTCICTLACASQSKKHMQMYEISKSAWNGNSVYFRNAYFCSFIQNIITGYQLKVNCHLQHIFSSIVMYFWLKQDIQWEKWELIG